MATENLTTVNNAFSSDKGELPASPPLAVLPLNASAKLDQEPNPFEQSFSSAAAAAASEEKLKSKAPYPTINKPILPPVAALTSPVPPLLRSGTLPKDVADHLAWDSLRTGPLSPSMLQGPANPLDFEQFIQPDPLPHPIRSIPAAATSTTSSSLVAAANRQHEEKINVRSGSMCSLTSVPSLSSAASHANHPIKNEQLQQSPSPKACSQEADMESRVNRKNSRRKVPTKDDKKRVRTPEEEEERRRNFLERNRIAALKCRQRKKQWLINLQAKVEYLTNDNEQLQRQAAVLREEIANLKTLLLAHKDCPLSQTDGIDASTLQQKPMMVQPPAMIHPSTTRPPPPSIRAACEENPQPSQPSTSTHPPLITNASTLPSVVFAPSSSSLDTSEPQMRIHHNIMTFPSRHQPPQQGMAAGTSCVLRF